MIVITGANGFIGKNLLLSFRRDKKMILVDTPETSPLANKIYGVTNKIVHSQKWGNDCIR